MVGREFGLDGLDDVLDRAAAADADVAHRGGEVLVYGADGGAALGGFDELEGGGFLGLGGGCGGEGGGQSAHGGGCWGCGVVGVDGLVEGGQSGREAVRVVDGEKDACGKWSEDGRARAEHARGLRCVCCRVRRAFTPVGVGACVVGWWGCLRHVLWLGGGQCGCGGCGGWVYGNATSVY